MILRWFPVIKIDDIDFAAMNDYLVDIVGETARRVIPFVRDFAETQLGNKRRKPGSVSSSREIKISDFRFSCTYTRGKSPRYPQFTLMVTAD